MARRHGLVVIEGVLICLLVVTGLRRMIMDAIPLPLKRAIGVGIGLFITLIGLVQAGFVTRIPDVAGSTSEATYRTSDGSCSSTVSPRPALVVVGSLMMSQVRDIPWDDLTIAAPALLAIIMVPFTYSITNGIGAAVIAYAVLKAATGRAHQVHWLLWLIAVAFLTRFALDPIEQLLNVH